MSAPLYFTLLKLRLSVPLSAFMISSELMARSGPAACMSRFSLRRREIQINRRDLHWLRRILGAHLDIASVHRTIEGRFIRRTSGVDIGIHVSSDGRAGRQSHARRRRELRHFGDRNIVSL